MAERADSENMFIFGMTAEEAAALDHAEYRPTSVYESDQRIRDVLNQLSGGFSDGISYDDISKSLLSSDTYRLLADFDSYVRAQGKAEETYRNRDLWNKKSLLNIAAAGYFAADRSVREYAQIIWHL
jgi:starch phosphorylase